MHSLTLLQRIDERPNKTHYGHTLMLGTSAGIRGVHDPKVLPFDTITYLLRANAARENLDDTSGLFFVFDKRLNGDTTDQTIIDQRTERLRQILDTLLPKFRMTTHRELEARGLASTNERVRPCADIVSDELREYTRIQTAQVLHMQAEAYTDSAKRFTKFGWILSRRSNGVSVGGEANFDQLLPNDAGIECVHTAPAFPLNSTNGKAPYLLNEADRAIRVCLPDYEANISDEVMKVQSGISRIAHDTLRATAETVLGLRSQIHSLNDELVTLPITKAMKRQISDERALTDLRDLLCASFRKLLP